MYRELGGVAPQFVSMPFGGSGSRACAVGHPHMRLRLRIFLCAVLTARLETAAGERPMPWSPLVIVEFGRPFTHPLELDHVRQPRRKKWWLPDALAASKNLAEVAGLDPAPKPLISWTR